MSNYDIMTNYRHTAADKTVLFNYSDSLAQILYNIVFTRCNEVLLLLSWKHEMCSKNTNV